MTERRELWKVTCPQYEGVNGHSTHGSEQDAINMAEKVNGKVHHFREVLPGDDARIPQMVCDLTEELQELKHEYAALVEAARAVVADVNFVSTGNLQDFGLQAPSYERLEALRLALENEQ